MSYLVTLTLRALRSEVKPTTGFDKNDKHASLLSPWYEIELQEAYKTDPRFGGLAQIVLI
jgi:hypothetical protein